MSPSTTTFYVSISLYFELSFLSTLNAKLNGVLNDEEEPWLENYSIDTFREEFCFLIPGSPVNEVAWG